MIARYRSRGLRIDPDASELKIHTDAVRWAKSAQLLFSELALLHHIPNGAKRTKAQRGALLGMGMKAGVSDLFLPVARHGYHGLYLEAKSRKGALTDAQLGWKVSVEAQGYKFCVFRSASEFADIILKYMKEQNV